MIPGGQNTHEHENKDHDDDMPMMNSPLSIFFLVL